MGLIVLHSEYDDFSEIHRDPVPPTATGSVILFARLPTKPALCIVRTEADFSSLQFF